MIKVLALTKLVLGYRLKDLFHVLATTLPVHLAASATIDAEAHDLAVTNVFPGS